MTGEEKAIEIRGRLTRETADEGLREVQDAVEMYPESASLLCLLGDLILLTDVDDYELIDARTSYERALQADANSAEANESLGYYHDVYEHDFVEAERYLRQAIALGGREYSYAGLARVLAETHRKSEALAVLDQCAGASDSVDELREEIESGVWDPL